MPRILVAINLPKRLSDLIVFARSVAQRMSEVAIFVDAIPSTAVFQSHIEALAMAQAVVLTRVKGAAVDRNALLRAVKVDLGQRRSFVQRVADANPENAASIIESSGFYVKRSSGHGKGEFVAKQAPASGSAHLYARGMRTRGSHEWQHSLDQIHWIDAEPTVRADTIIRNLAPGKTHYFRFRRVTKEGRGPWSQVVALLVA
jgi:hypothetical protein